MSTKQEIAQRREKVFQLKVMGVSIYDMPNAVGASVKTIMRDIAAMEDAVSAAMKDEPEFIEKLKVETMEILRGAYKELWRQYANADTARDKAVIVKMIVDTVDKKCSILQRLGVLQSQPNIQLNHQNNIELSWEAAPLPPSAETIDGKTDICDYAAKDAIPAGEKKDRDKLLPA